MRDERKTDSNKEQERKREREEEKGESNDVEKCREKRSPGGGNKVREGRISRRVAHV